LKRAAKSCSRTSTGRPPEIFTSDPFLLLPVYVQTIRIPTRKVENLFLSLCFYSFRGSGWRILRIFWMVPATRLSFFFPFFKPPRGVFHPPSARFFSDLFSPPVRPCVFFPTRIGRASTEGVAHHFSSTHTKPPPILAIFSSFLSFYGFNSSPPPPHLSVGVVDSHLVRGDHVAGLTPFSPRDA